MANTKANYIFLKSAGIPITHFNITFRVGSADDPAGKEGLARLTALLLREGGVKAWKSMPARSREELEEFLFPLAAEIGVSVGKEQTSFTVTSSADDAETVFGVLAQMILQPALAATELARLRGEQLDALSKQLPREDEEELGKAALDRLMYGKGHPYAHVTAGTVSGVKSITSEEIGAFHRANFTSQRATVGVAGVISPRLAARIRKAFGELPSGQATKAKVSPAPETTQPRLLIVKGPFDATGVHLGQPLPFNRSGGDFPRMYLAALAFGKHRSFVGRLMRVVREVRGLNYGTYAYVEDFPHGGALLMEPTQAARERQAFTVWARPTTLPNGCFLLRQVRREIARIARNGLSAEEFRLGQSHLVGNAPLLATSLERRLGYAIDSRFYGIKGDYLRKLQKQAEAAKRAEVNALLGQYLDPSRMHIVVVTPDPGKFKEEILEPSCGIHYSAGVAKPPEVLTEDREIGAYPVGVKAEDIQVIEAEELFQ